MPKRNKTFEVYLVYIDSEKCDGCGDCQIYCPTDVFDVFHKAFPSKSNNCLGCRTCETICKSNAVIVTEI